MQGYGDSMSDLQNTARICEQPYKSTRAVPEATFTPTAAVLCLELGAESVIPEHMQAVIAEPSSRAYLQECSNLGMHHQGILLFSVAPSQCWGPQFQGEFPTIPDPCFSAPSQKSQSLLSEEGETRELNLSDD